MSLRLLTLKLKRNIISCSKSYLFLSLQGSIYTTWSCGVFFLNIVTVDSIAPRRPKCCEVTKKMIKGRICWNLLATDTMTVLIGTKIKQSAFKKKSSREHSLNKNENKMKFTSAKVFYGWLKGLQRNLARNNHPVFKLTDDRSSHGDSEIILELITVEDT